MKYIISIMTLTLFFIEAGAQNLVYGNDTALDDYSYHVGLISTFMSRLNGDSSISGNMDSLSRRIDIASLFKQEAFLSNHLYAEDFSQKVIARAEYIDFTDTCWHAIASCIVEHDGKEEEVTLILKTECCEDVVYKWIIVKAYADFLNLEPEKKNPGLKIMPSANELNFMQLSHISTQEHQNILNYACSSYVHDPTTVLYAMIHQGILRIKYVKDLSYVFSDIAGYRLKVNHFLGEGRSGGWLISEIQPQIEHPARIPYKCLM